MVNGLQVSSLLTPQSHSHNDTHMLIHTQQKIPSKVSGVITIHTYTHTPMAMPSGAIWNPSVFHLSSNLGPMHGGYHDNRPALDPSHS